MTTAEILLRQALSDLRDGLDAVPMTSAALAAMNDDTSIDELADLDELAADLDVSHLS